MGDMSVLAYWLAERPALERPALVAAGSEAAQQRRGVSGLGVVCCLAVVLVALAVYILIRNRSSGGGGGGSGGGPVQ
jgi:hypothetical protein